MKNSQISSLLARPCSCLLVILGIIIPHLAAAEDTLIIGGARTGYSPQPAMAYHTAGAMTTYPYTNDAQSLSRPSILYFPPSQYPRSITAVQGFSSSAQPIVTTLTIAPQPRYGSQLPNRTLLSGFAKSPQSQSLVQPATATPSTAILSKEVIEAEQKTKPQDVQGLKHRYRAPVARSIVVAAADKLQAAEAVEIPEALQQEYPAIDSDLSPTSASQGAAATDSKAFETAINLTIPNSAAAMETTESLEQQTPRSETSSATTVRAVWRPTQSPLLEGDDADNLTPRPALEFLVAENGPQTGALDLFNSPLQLEFSNGSSDLTPKNEQSLESLVVAMKADEDLKVRLLAYAESGDEQVSAARRLSLFRSLAVRDFLLDQGIRSTRIRVRALGDKSVSGNPDRVDIIAVP